MGFLLVVLSHLGGFFQPVDDFLYLLFVKYVKWHFGYFSVLFHHLGVESVGDGAFRVGAGVGGFQVGVVPFDLFLGDAVIEVDGGGGDKVFPGVLREAGGRHLRIVDDVQKLGAGGFVKVHRAVHQLAKILFRTLWKKLLVGVVMVHPV